MNEVEVASRSVATDVAPRSTPVFSLACGVVMLLLSVSARPAAPLCGPDDTAVPQLQFETSAGLIEIRLYPEAAPNAVAGLIALANEPHAGDEFYFDGLTVDYTRPHVEIRTAQRPSTSVAFTQEIDADALGLHEQRIRTGGQAMNAVQDELLPAFRRERGAGGLTPQHARWLEAWYEDYDANFLVGVSRKQINEALGHPYVSGLASRPVTKGSVALKPGSTQFATSVLSIALTDMPQRTGTWMVVGEVVQGLELADRISTAPLDKPKHVRSRTYKPRDPVVIQSVRMECG